MTTPFRNPAQAATYHRECQDAALVHMEDALEAVSVERRTIAAAHKRLEAAQAAYEDAHRRADRHGGLLARCEEQIREQAAQAATTAPQWPAPALPADPFTPAQMATMAANVAADRHRVEAAEQRRVNSIEAARARLDANSDGIEEERRYRAIAATQPATPAGVRAARAALRAANSIARANGR